MTTRLLLLLLLIATGTACTQSPAESETLAQLEELERRLEKGRELEKKLPALEAEIAAVTATIEDLDAVLVADEADALVRLRTALERSGFGVVDIRSQGESTVEGVRVVRFEVDAVTRFAAASRVFETLAVQPTIVLVENLSMKRDGENARVSFTAQLGLASEPD